MSMKPRWLIWINPRYLVAVLQIAKYQPFFCEWINLLYHSLGAVVQVNGKRSNAFALLRSVRQGCPLSLLLYALTLKPLLCRPRDRACSPVLCRISLPQDAWAKISMYADDVYVFKSWRSDWGCAWRWLAKINRNKSSSLRLGSWKRVALPYPFSWTDGPLSSSLIWVGSFAGEELVGGRGKGISGGFP